MEISIKRTPKNTGKDVNVSAEELLDLINTAAFMSEALDERITLIGRICEDEINRIDTKIEKVAELLADTAMTQGQKEIIIKGIKSINEDLDYVSKEFTKKPLEQEFNTKINNLRKKYNIKDDG